MRVITELKLTLGSFTKMRSKFYRKTLNFKGLALLEVVVAMLIVILLAIPIFRVFSSSNQMFDSLRRKSLANQLAHKIIEDISALSYLGSLDKISQHDDFRGVVPKSGVELSPYFKSIDSQTKGLSEEHYPNLIRDLREFRCRVSLKPALDLNDTDKFKMANVEIKYATKEGEFKVVSMQTIVSVLPQLR